MWQSGGSGMFVLPESLDEMPLEDVIWYARRAQEERSREAKASARGRTPSRSPKRGKRR